MPITDEDYFEKIKKERRGVFAQLLFFLALPTLPTLEERA